MIEVIVSNIGIVARFGSSDQSYKEAEKVYETYVELSKANMGRAGGESVVMMKDGVPIKGYNPPEQSET